MRRKMVSGREGGEEKGRGKKGESIHAERMEERERKGTTSQQESGSE
jgi:hypothetical protein